MTNRLHNKRALITGGTSGIGLETAKQFLAEGARVMVTGSSEESLDEARRQLGSDALFLIFSKTDAGNLAEQKKLAQLVEDSFGQLDVAFLNAGIGVFMPLDAWDEAAFDRSLAVNLKGPFFLLQALLGTFANPASIILNASVNAHLGVPASSVYSMTKAGMISLAKTLSGELIGRGIRVNTVSPGTVTTPIYGKLGLPDEALQQMKDGLIALTPAHRFGLPVEIAKAVVFLASDESTYAVGSEFILDGGLTIA
ncbi:NAD(P)-dependent dehydrogenase, short-chain alcohol dehydrogenase family [Polaromonas sp. YR568]|uniref:SDR family oxidoreductase n=1 Tax=Polaromonas sp. YR568 TaxID=1855301 RepID=UPI0008E97A5A|nr:SDR family oxidoreductase [Polaromonas sp. YR568]SFV02357.1 NAD(P)-dependent dehydrogenase, short-chain alcohol dehydrogenase family [Polaromonas sp. YR568]